MGEVSRTRADRRNSKYREGCTIERLIGAWPRQINSESVEKIAEERVQVEKKLENTNETSSSIIENDGLADSHSISGFRHEGPLSKNPPKFHQNHIPCTLLHGCRADEATAAEDSSYDSDEESTSSTHSQSHAGVSRTVSATLAAEFADYVTLQPPALSTHPGYSSRVEFALKLGYTERLVQAALLKLGPEPGQDELLAELIRLGAGHKSLDDDLTQDLPAEETPTPGVFLRPVVIDGSNVAMSHGNKELFSCRGIKLCVDWFRARGHREITVFVPKWRKESSRPDKPIADQEILGELERDRLLVFTPSRLINGKRLVCYDDRYILRLAVEVDGIVVSNDNYRDLAQESPEFRRVVEERILMYSFVNDRFMPPDDPLGRGGPTLDNFLRVSPRRGAHLPCPYAKKCTYGNKCKFRHPERGETPQKSVTEQLVEHAQRHLRARGPSLSLPLPTTPNKSGHRPLCRTQSASLPQKEEAVGYRTPGYQQFGWQENAHKKLQRQLTLNPNCDLRLYHLRRQQYYSQPGQQQVKNDSNNNKSCPYGEGDLTAGGRNNYQSHRHVTRISSAPDSSVAWAPPPAPSPGPLHADLRLGVSDPQLNLVPYPVAINPAQDTQIYAARQRLHYHLAHIFPGEHVQVAMALHPHETDPQQICATILAMFPKQ